MLRLLGLLLVVWLVITVIGLLFFLATVALGWNKRDNKALPRRW